MPVITNIEDLRVMAEARAADVLRLCRPGSWTESTYRGNGPIFRASSFASAWQSTWRAHHTHADDRSGRRDASRHRADRADRHATR